MKSQNFYYRIIPLYYFFFFGGQSLITSYMNVYLEKSLGFSGSQLGLYHIIKDSYPEKTVYTVGDLTPRYSFMLPTSITLLLLIISKEVGQ